MSRKSLEPEWEAHLPVILMGWDSSYHFGLKATQYVEDTIGPYEESQTIIMYGSVFGTHKKLSIAADLPVEIHIFSKDEKDLSEDKRDIPSSGVMLLHRGTLSITQFIPRSSFGYFAAMLASGKAKVAILTASRLIRKKAFIRGLGIYTKFDEEEW